MNAPVLSQETKRTLAWIAVAIVFLALLKLCLLYTSDAADECCGV